MPVRVEQPEADRGTAARFFPDRKSRLRDRALVDVLINGKLRGCDLARLNVDIASGADIRTRAIVVQHKT